MDVQLDKPPRSGYTYVSEVVRKLRRRLLWEAIFMILVALIGIGFLLFAVTPR